MPERAAGIGQVIEIDARTSRDRSTPSPRAAYRTVTCALPDALHEGTFRMTAEHRITIRRQGTERWTASSSADASRTLELTRRGRLWDGLVIGAHGGRLVNAYSWQILIRHAFTARLP